jgi:hypothetical protein
MNEVVLRPITPTTATGFTKTYTGGSMSEKTEDPGVLGSLPSTRPTRFGGERSARGAKPKRAAATAKPRAAAKPKRAAGTAKPRAAGADAAPSPKPPRRPRPVRAGAPTLEEPTARARTQEPPEPGASPPTGTELVTTAIQAAGELAQIGLTLGGQVLKRAVKRLPKP